MTVLEFIDHLRGLDVKLSAEGDRLRCNAPDGVLTSELREELAQRKQEILKLLSSRAVAHPPKIQPAAQANNLPLSFGQEQLWFLDLLEPGNSSYNLSIAVVLTGALDISALERSLNEVIRRHTVLRSTFPTVEGRAHQVISPFLPLTLPLLDLSHLPRAEGEATARKVAVEEARLPFDLGQSPLLRVRLIRLAAEEHVVVLILHHIICDGWSLIVLVRELGRLYESYVTGGPSPLPELGIQYGDYAVWQREWLQGEVLERQLEYWRNQLAGMQALELASSEVRPAIQRGRGGEEVMALDAELVRRLRRLSEAAGVTLFMTLLAAFQTLLFRYTGQQDIGVSTRIAGRHRLETEDLIGFFVNQLILRADLSGQPTFREVLQQVRTVCLEAYAHQDVPFEYLVKSLRQQRDLSRQQFSSVMFVLENLPRSDLALSGLKCRPFDFEHVTTAFDLDLAISEEPQGMMAVMTFCADLFDHPTITRMLNHYRMILESVVDDPDKPVTSIPLLTSHETRQLLHDWNQTTIDYRSVESLNVLFETQVRQQPDAVALIFDGGSVSYGELNVVVNQLAHQLHAVGVGPEAPVAVYMERSLRSAIGLLAVLKAGGAYVPLDEAWPSRQIESVLREIDVPVILTETKLKPRLSSHNARVICLDERPETPAKHINTGPPECVVNENLAYVIYTSGSTGRPKGVAVSHGQLLKRFEWMWRVYPFAANEVACQRTALSFAVSIYELLGPLLQGVPVLIVPDDTVKNPLRFVELLEHYRVSRIVMVPTLLRQILDTDIDLEVRLASLRFCTSLGEPLSPELCNRFHERVPQATVINDYGASEVTAISWYESKEFSCNPGHVPVGRPIDNVQVYLLDDALQPVPLGLVGDIYVTGKTLAREYYKRPELTAEKFLSNPFSLAGGTRLYRTGDLGRYRIDGNIEHLGRRDQQVKIRGVRIDLEGIESILRQQSAVREAIVMAHLDHNSETRLGAYLVAGGQPVPTNREFRQFLEDRLPSYMIPASFVWLSKFPLTASGKVDRQALLSMKPIREWPREGEHSQAETAAEKALSEIWAGVLGLEQVGMNENFFELGGDSILSIQIIARARQAGLELTPKQLFQNQTVRELAAVAQNYTPSASWKAPAPVISSENSRRYTPMDFPAARLTQQELDKLIELIGDTGKERIN
jgi:amino acid adenylation domain-containing protein